MTPPPASTADTTALLAQTGWVRGLARRLVRDPELAEDLAQSTVLAALEHRPSPDRSLRGWLATVLKNLVRQDRRTGGRREARERGAAVDEATSSTADLVERFSMHRRVAEEVAHLAEPYRETILLRYFEDLSPTEIARRTGVPVSTVKTRLARALERLRGRLDRANDGDRRAWVLALLPVTRDTGGAAVQTLGAFLVSTHLKIAALLCAASAGLYFAWPAPEDVGASPSAAAVDPSAEETAPDATPVELAGVEEGETERVAAAEPEVPAAPRDEVTVAPIAGAGVVQGRVYDEEGTPAAGVGLRLVRADRNEATEGEARLEGALATVSKSGGRFRFDEPWDEDGYVEAADDDLVTVMRGTVGGRRKSVEPVVVVAPRITLAGRVVDEAGHPIPGVRVWTSMPDGFRGRFEHAFDASVGQDNDVETDVDGRFELPNTAGIDGSTMRAAEEGYAPYAEPLPLLSDAGILVTLVRPVELAGMLVGRVIDQGGEPVPDASVSYGLDATRTDEYGAFRFAHDDPESFNTMATSRFGLPAASRLIAVKEGFQPARLDVAADDSGGVITWPDDIVLRLGGPPLTLSGRVVDEAGEPLEGLRVWVADVTLLSFSPTGASIVEGVLSGDTERRWRWVETDTHGEFELTGLADREYTVVAMDTGTLLRVHSEPLRAGTTGAEIVFETGAVWKRVGGRVVSRDGQPVPGVSVAPMTDSFRLYYADNPVSTSHSTLDAVETDAEGRFELEELPRDLVYLRLDGSDIISLEYGRGEPLRDLAGDDIEDLEIVVGLRVRFQVELSDSAEADRIAVLDDDGKVLTINIIEAFSRSEGPDAELVDGRTEVLTVTDAAETLVLYLGGEEVRRVPLELQRGTVNRITP